MGGETWRSVRVLVWCVGALLGCAGLCASSATALPDGRAYELVSPPAKNGGEIIPDSGRTRAATDGHAVGFTSLAAFGDVVGTGIATDYVAVRQSGTPVGNGWTTHAITPRQSADTYHGIINSFEPLYVGEFSPDLRFGVFSAFSPVTADPFVQGVFNLYRRSDVATPGAGAYDLLTACPACAAGAGPLSVPPTANAAFSYRAILAGMSPDGSRVLFESPQPLTLDTPVVTSRVQLFEWDQGAGVQLAGRIPSGGATQCDDISGPACVAADVSIAGQGAGANLNNDVFNVPHVLSDGSDGHSRVIFTRPTQDGATVDPHGFAGQLFMRVDGHATVAVSASERTSAPDRFAPATFWDASSDGSRVFFTTRQALTDDAPTDGTRKLYVYDANAADGQHLTFVSSDQEPGDGVGGEVDAVIGTSTDGHAVYFIAHGQRVSGAPLLGTSPGIFLWRDGLLAYVGPVTPDSGQDELGSAGKLLVLRPRQARVSPDGSHLLFSAFSGVGLTGYDHGGCVTSLTGQPGCRELYVYSEAQSSPSVPSIACASCRPDGVAATAMATDVIRTNNSATQTSWHQTHAMSDDGSRVFFSTAEALVPQDVNGVVDVYEYDTVAHSVQLVSTGTSPDDSWFLDATPNGSDVFFDTRQQLVGWDTDQAYDLYDARVGGGFPEPVPVTACATADTCRGALTTPPAAQAIASDVVRGAGNVGGRLRAPVVRCRRGFVRKRVRGRVRCVKRAPVHRRVRAHAKRAMRAVRGRS